ncbi:hypothetical protein LTR28_010589 [Elasticomyces elasticus]|nr:hypothetical protein LTR28_010589 [Elasticomyces elasticus]
MPASGSLIALRAAKGLPCTELTHASRFVKTQPPPTVRVIEVDDQTSSLSVAPLLPQSTYVPPTVPSRPPPQTKTQQIFNPSPLNQLQSSPSHAQPSSPDKSSTDPEYGDIDIVLDLDTAASPRKIPQDTAVALTALQWGTRGKLRPALERKTGYVESARRESHHAYLELGEILW